ncbi:hypothetical protein DQ04_08231000, partial [Trypanosoma grayi]|uniref:hypothetical protein n=1 Tax=Trypanosoma grayi TaxID=71804 RepID=UPI0004F40D7F
MHFRRAFLSPALTDILLVSPAQQGRQAACSSSSCMHHGRVTSFTSSSSVKFRRRGVLLVTLLPAAQGSPFLVSSLWNARRFAACGRTPTFTELSEAFSI